MKLIIDISKEDYNDIKNCNPEVETEYVLDLLMKGTPIPDTATKGEAILALFPKAKYKIIEHLTSVFVMTDLTQVFDIKWWRSPFKMEEDKTE